MNPVDFYALADYLFANYPSGKREAAVRSAVSRAYYAAFLYARDVMRSWGCFLTTKAVHSQVSQGLKCSGRRSFFLLGDKVAKLCREREKADYELDDAYAVDFHRIRRYYRTVIDGLAEEWTSLDEQARKEALRKMQGKISQIQGATL